MKPRWIAIAAALAAAAPATALACGACDEDKIAATYDHAVIDAAIAGSIVKWYSSRSTAVDAPDPCAHRRRRGKGARGPGRNASHVAGSPRLFVRARHDTDTERRGGEVPQGGR